ncbi:TraE/TraK family type IV conjugative transfer system protein [Massilia sp.]|uniref:TraE/TraK family type IV conjugative transfer system protein n=1 Tax=Massilia sp. TaxID=1882437 RepID=UPI00352F61DE
MDIATRTSTIGELQTSNKRLMMSNAGLVAALLIAVISIFMQDKIVIRQIPGMPTNAEVRKSSMDVGAQRAILLAVTSNIVQVNPSNAHYQKMFLQAFLAPAVYTKVSMEIDAKAKLLADQRELGSYYFVFREYQYDPKIDKHFVIGEVHTVNAAKDTGEPYVFEYPVHVDNYRLVVDDIVSYKGDKAHNASWLEGQKR